MAQQNLASEFTNNYVCGLRDGNAQIQDHFAAYFSREIDFWLRSRLRDRTAIEDVRQETLRRVLQTLLRGDGLRDANRLRQFVNGICKNVLLEHWRAETKTAERAVCLDDLDELPGPEQTSRSTEDHSHLRTALMKIPAHDRAVLTMLYVEELDRSEISERVGVNRGHLRVLVHRAISRLRASFTGSTV